MEPYGYTYDAVGNLTEAATPSGTTTHAYDAGTSSPTYRYDPYGALRPGSPDPSGFGYAGEWKDATGLVNLRARAYDPEIGRFLSRDTVEGVASAPPSPATATSTGSRTPCATRIPQDTSTRS